MEQTALWPPCSADLYYNHGNHITSLIMQAADVDNDMEPIVH